MPESAHARERAPEETRPFDYSTPQAQEVLAHFGEMLGSLRVRAECASSALEGEIEALQSENAALQGHTTELRSENTALLGYNAELKIHSADLQRYSAELERRIRFHEKTLGLVVLPMLLRRWMLRVTRRTGSSTR